MYRALYFYTASLTNFFVHPVCEHTSERILLGAGVGVQLIPSFMWHLIALEPKQFLEYSIPDQTFKHRMVMSASEGNYFAWYSADIGCFHWKLLSTVFLF